MLTMTQPTLNASLALSVAREYYGFTSGPVMIVVTDPVASTGPHRLHAVYAYFYTGDVLRNPTEEELKLYWPKA